MWFGLFGNGRHQAELFELREQLKAERALNSEYNDYCDELLTMLESSRKLSATQGEIINQYEALCQNKVKPFAEAVLLLLDREREC